MPYQPKLLTNRVVVDPSTIAYPDGSNADLSCNAEGALYVATAITPPGPPPDGWFEINAYSALHIISVPGCLLFTVNGFLAADATVVRFVQFFDASPTAGDTPVQSFCVSPGAGFSWTPSYPRGSGPNFTVAVSTTPDSYTASTDKAWIHAEIFLS